MNDISKIDKNLLIKTTIEKDDVVFHDAESEPMKLLGIFREGDCLRRMPMDVARSVNEGVYSLHACSAGGRVLFETDSPYVAIYAEYAYFSKMPHEAFSGSSGFDMYEEVGDAQKHVHTFVPSITTVDVLQGIRDFGIKKQRKLTINFPLYSEVKKLYIGLQKESTLRPYNPYRDIPPIVYYGSSITQGGCASRAGMSYQGILSRRLNVDYLNLGFSGSAKAEKAISDYIQTLDMSIFVYDYDHNAPTTEHLEKTHERMFLEIREKHPTLPIVMMNRPCFVPSNPIYYERKKVVEATYLHAKARGDQNVYFVSGEEQTALCGTEGSVDLTHPTDLGFMSMALALEKVLSKILDKTYKNID